MLPRTTLVSLLFPLLFAPSIDGQSLGFADTAPQRGEHELALVFEGTVVDARGAPTEGAVVVSSAGGKAVTDRSGRYRLEVSVPTGAERVEITAVGGTGGTLAASTSIPLAPATSIVRVAPLELTSGSTCQPSWLPTFGGTPGTNCIVYALAVFDDGSGPALYAGGSFTSASGTAANAIAKWSGSSWSALGTGIGMSGGTNTVYALTVYDDGGGPALCAGGDFTIAGGTAASNIAKWNGSTWAALGTGMSGGGLSGNYVRALTVYDDGSGPALYAGGLFTIAGGIPAMLIAKWNGSSWSALGSGLSGTGSTPSVNALTVYDDGGGPALYAGGLFTSAGGVAANSIAKWNGSAWSALGTGLSGGGLAGTYVNALTAYDDGGGPVLCVGGNFTVAGGTGAICIARWNGSSWSSLGSGVTGVVSALTVYDHGGGPALYAGGYFLSISGSAGNCIARWNGSSWTALGSGMNDTVDALTVYDDGAGPALYAGGRFTSAGGAAANYVSKWNGSSWTILGDSGMNSAVYALTVYDDGSGPALYAGGSFTSAGGVAASSIAKWNGTTWSPLGSGTDGYVYALTVYDDGGGPALYAGGKFIYAGGFGFGASNIAKWNGSSWTALGSGMNDFVYALTVFDDGSGPALYAGGSFTQAGATMANYIAKWNGSTWSALGTGMSGGGIAGTYYVSALTVYDDGGGPALYAGGSFRSAGGTAANSIAKWNGSSWTALGIGVSGGFGGSVSALTVYDDGGGPALYAGGFFTSAGGIAANSIAKWNGSSWSALGSGVLFFVNALRVYDDGGGPALYVGGAFFSAGGTAVSNIAKWNGSSWTALGSGVNSGVRALTVFNDRTGPALYAGGEFGSAFDSGDSFLAKWGCPDTNPPTITCPPSISVDDRPANGRGERIEFAVVVVDAEDPTPTLVCVPPSGSLFPRGTTTVTCTATDFSGNQSTCQFNVTVRGKVRQP